jgi:predicted RNA binding protein with dsRBD fold (UPF0201 family)
MDEISVRVEAEVNPTESEEKVKRAVENIFLNMKMQTKPLAKGSMLIAEAESKVAFTRLHSMLRRDRIRAAARKVLLEGVSGKTISFCLNKQVAYAGHASFSKEEAESPLGPIKVKIHCSNPRELVKWLTSENV